MQQRLLYLAGPLAGVVFFSAVYTLAPMVDGYSHVSQTVSEIGEYGSPAKLPYQIAMLIVSLCLLVFASSLYSFAKANNASILPSCFIAFFGIAESGIALFPSPHPMHNLFGLSMTIGYMTPLVLAWSWKSLANANTLKSASWVAFALVVITMFLNLSPIFARDLYPLNYYGIVQRSLFVAFYGWCLYVGVELFARSRRSID
jgi:hypothetical membrane protein